MAFIMIMRLNSNGYFAFLWLYVWAISLGIDFFLFRFCLLCGLLVLFSPLTWGRSSTMLLGSTLLFYAICLGVFSPPLWIFWGRLLVLGTPDWPCSAIALLCCALALRCFGAIPGFLVHHVAGRYFGLLSLGNCVLPVVFNLGSHHFLVFFLWSMMLTFLSMFGLRPLVLFKNAQSFPLCWPHSSCTAVYVMFFPFNFYDLWPAYLFHLFFSSSIVAGSFLSLFMVTDCKVWIIQSKISPLPFFSAQLYFSPCVTAQLLLDLRFLQGPHILCPASVLCYSSLPWAFLCPTLLTRTGALVNHYACLGHRMIVIVSPSFWEIAGWAWRQSSVPAGADQTYLHDFLSFIFLAPTSTIKCYWKCNFILFGFGLYDQDWWGHTGSLDVLYCVCISFLDCNKVFSMVCISSWGDILVIFNLIPAHFIVFSRVLCIVVKRYGVHFNIFLSSLPMVSGHKAQALWPMAIPLNLLSGHHFSCIEKHMAGNILFLYFVLYDHNGLLKNFLCGWRSWCLFSFLSPLNFAIGISMEVMQFRGLLNYSILTNMLLNDSLDRLAPSLKNSITSFSYENYLLECSRSKKISTPTRSRIY